MKIALVSPYDYPYPGAVTEHISYLNRYFERAGHEVRILAPSSHDDVEERMQHVYRVGKRIIGVPANQSIARITLSLNLSRAVRRILETENFDVIHLHEPLVPALSPTVLRRSRSINVGTFHASRRKYFGYYYGRPLLKRYIRRIHGRICVSNAARDFVSHYFPGDYRIIPNGVDVDAFRVQRPLIPELNDGKLTMLFVGRLEKRKGLVYLLRALPYVQHHFPQLRLIVVGAFDEEDMREYRQVVAELGLRDVVFKGFVSTEDKLRYYQMCDLFVSPALGRESQGIVLLEAMAAGKPVIASDIDGYRAVLRHGFEGLLVPPESPAALAVAIVRLFSDPALREEMGRRAQARAQGYGWPIVARQLLDFYAETIERQQPRRRLPHTALPIMSNGA